MLKDRFTLGFIAGVIGAVPMNVMNLVNYYVTHLAKLRYLDFAGVMIFRRLPGTLSEVILSQIVQIGFSGALGVIFAYLLILVNKKNLWFKGFFWGTGSWFIIYALTVLFKISELSKPDFTTALLQYISTGIYGVTMALTLVWLEKRVESAKPEKLRRYCISPMPSYKRRSDTKRVKIRKPYKIR